jgi:polyhydroxyalkanoate synthesis regulator phasin
VAHTKRKLAAGALAALAVAGGGVAVGATQLGSPKEESQAVIADAAKQLGVEPAKLSAALNTALENRVDAAVAAGKITKAEGDALKARIQSGEAPLFATRRPHGFGPGHHGPNHGPSLDAAATYLGLTEAQLKTELQSGKTFAEIAKAHGKTAEGLANALVDAAKKKLDAAVAAGRLTRAEADSMLSELKKRTTDLVNGKFAPRFGEHRGLHGPNLDAAETYLGLTEAQLRTELSSGKTLAQIAKAHGKTAEGLVQALVDAADKKLDAAVKTGRLTRAEADEMLAGLKERITDFVNGRFPRPFGEHHGMRGFHRGPGAFIGPPPGP